MILAILIIIMFSIIALFNNILYHEAIKQGAKNTVTALEMVVACQQLSNVTSEQVKEQYIKTFILNNSRENDF
jgi:hypothetical protein